MKGGALYETLGLMITHLDDPPSAAELFVRFELLVLEELGFGLDLERCAATGARDDLAYVSPKSGRAGFFFPLSFLSSLSAARRASHGMTACLRCRPFCAPAPVARACAAAPRRSTPPSALRASSLHRNLYEPRGIDEPIARASFITALARPRIPSNGEDAA